MSDSEGDDTEVQALLQKRLEAMGEDFLGSFSDGKRPKEGKRRAPASASSKSNGAANLQVSKDEPLVPRKKKRKKRGASLPLGQEQLDASPKEKDSAQSTPGKLAIPGKSKVAPAAEGPSSKTPPATVGLPSKAERKRFMSGNVSDIFADAKPPPRRRREEPEEPEDTKEFNKALKDMLDLVLPSLERKERQQYEEAKIRALGGTIEKRRKIPANELPSQRRNAAKKRNKALEEEKHLGVKLNASGHRDLRAVDKLIADKKRSVREKRQRREEGIMRLGMGAREKGGVAVLNLGGQSGGSKRKGKGKGKGKGKSKGKGKGKR